MIYGGPALVLGLLLIVAAIDGIVHRVKQRNHRRRREGDTWPRW